MKTFQLAIFNTQPPHLYEGGVERRIIQTAQRLKTHAEIAVYSGTKAGFRQPAEINGVHFFPVNSTDRVFPLDNWSFNRNLSKKISQIKADVYEAHAVSGYKIPDTLKENAINKPFIHTIHGVLADEYEQAKKNPNQMLREKSANLFMSYLAKLEGQTAKKATTIVTISKYSVEKIQKYYGIDPKMIHIVPNGVDTDFFRPKSDQIMTRQQFGLREGPCVLFVGNLIPRKGLPYLIEAAKQIIRKHPETTFAMAGEGPLKDRLINSVQKQKIASNFKFLGKVEENLLPSLYNTSDVFVLPSLQEGQGIVLLEAQASRIPVVAFETGGVKEAVRNGKTGFLVNPKDSSALADAVIKLLDDKILREKMGLDGRKFVVENFTWDICAQKMLDVYQKTLSD
jgi:glycosyltransferase involved in cell wall biosynthesis